MRKTVPVIRLCNCIVVVGEAEIESGLVRRNRLCVDNERNVPRAGS